MTDEEYREYERLRAEYNRLVSINADLAEQVDYAERNIGILVGNMAVVSANVVPKVKYVSDKVDVADNDIDALMNALESLTKQYFVFKELSTASKNLTQFNDEYYSKFAFYNELRRITLGYVIGLDSYIISNESLRKKVEKSYLANTDYWLSYAIMSVMLWASNEQEAAQRALEKALKMDSKKSAVFYMLINMRFSRKEAASKWYIYYLDRTDVNDLGDEWQKLLQAYLTGAMGNNKKLEESAEEYYKKIFVQTQAINAGYDRRVQTRAEEFITNFPHVTKRTFPNLSLYSPEYQRIIANLSAFEKLGVVAQYYDDIDAMTEDEANNVKERIENVLYDLINSYDDKEAELIRNIKYNESIIAAKGDVSAAQLRYYEMYGNPDMKYNAGEMLIKWAFSEDYVETDVTVKKFALSQLCDNIAEGFRTYCEKLKNAFNESVNVNIDGCQLNCTRNNYDDCDSKMRDFFLKNKIAYAFKDKLFIIFLFICAGALLLLGASALFFSNPTAFAVLLSLGLIAGALGGFLVWKRYTDISKELEEKYRRGKVTLTNLFRELEAWRNSVYSEAKGETDLINSVMKFKQ